MAIDVCTEIASPGISPRISFSHDLNQTADGPQGLEDEGHHSNPRLDSSLLDSDLHFCFNNNSFIQELSPADELFSNGQILPIHKKKPSQFTRFQVPSCQAQDRSDECSPPLPEFNKEIVPVSNKTSSPSKSLIFEHPMGMDKANPRLRRAISIDQATSEKKLLKEFLAMGLDQVEEKPNVAKSFWTFKRSNSLNCDNTKNKGLIRSLHFLSRSNSTGSAPNPRKQSFPMQSKESQPHKPQFQRQASVSGRRRSSVSGPGPFYPYSYNMTTQKSPVLRKCGSYGNGSSVRVSPVLNIPAPCISRGAVSLFGFGSLFCSGKLKKKKRSS